MTQAQQELREKAERSFRVAKKLYDDGEYDFSASRAYYALFYVVEALLLDKGGTFSKHSAVISAFYRLFVKEGLLDKKFHQLFTTAYDLRQEGDYLSGTSVSQDSCQKLLIESEDFFRETAKLFD